MADLIRLRHPRSHASRELRELLTAGRSETPDPARLLGVASRLGFPASAVPSGAELLAKSGAGGLGLGGATKIGAVVLVLAAGAGAGLLASNDRAVLPASQVVLAPETTTAGAVATTPPVAQSADVAPPQEPVLQPSPAAPVRRSGVRVGGRGAIAAPAMSAVASPPASEGTASLPARIDSRAPSTWGGAVPLAPEAPVDAGSSADLAPLEEARRVLAGNPSRALYLALRDERTSGGVVEEREVVIIEALVRLGRAGEARERAARFLRLFPVSTHREEVAAPFGFDPGAQNP